MTWRNLKFGAVFLVISLGVVQASPDDPTAAGGDSGGGAVVSGSVTAKLSVPEMTTRVARMRSEMDDAASRMTELQLLARKAKDVIKLNCVNDKYLLVKQLLNNADDARVDFETGGDAREAAYVQITVASERVTDLRMEAEACVGEGEMFVGATRVTVSAPRIVDDPTVIDPFTLTDIEIERPTYATPFL